MASADAAQEGPRGGVKRVLQILAFEGVGKDELTLGHRSPGELYSPCYTAYLEKCSHTTLMDDGRLDWTTCASTYRKTTGK